MMSAILWSKNKTSLRIYLLASILAEILLFGLMKSWFLLLFFLFFGVISLIGTGNKNNTDSQAMSRKEVVINLTAYNLIAIVLGVICWQLLNMIGGIEIIIQILS